jgi:hypothetical protein
MHTQHLPHRLPIALLGIFTALACGHAERPSTISGDGPSTAGASASDDGSIDEWAYDSSSVPCPKSAPSVLGTSRSELSSSPLCRPTTGARTFSRALCSCEDTNVAGFLHTRSFRSRTDAAGTERLGGSVGVNRSYITGGLADIGGSFVVSGERDILFGGLLAVGGELRFEPAFDVAGMVSVGGDAHLRRSLRAIGLIGIHGDLYRSAESQFLGLALVDVAGERHTAPVDVEAPCACGEGERVNVAAAVAAAREDNDNAEVGLDPHGLDLAVGIGRALTLPSGRYYVHQVGSLGAIELAIDGKVELYVGDDFLAGPLFAVTLAPGAELDLFVQDNFALAGAAVLGDPRRPAATRIYVGGTGDIAVAGLNAFAGNLYAPTANVLVGGVGKVFGSLFGKNIVAAGLLDVGFDESVLAGVECSEPEPPAQEPPHGDPPANEPPANEPPTSGPPANEPGPTPTEQPPARDDDPDPCTGHDVATPH